MTQAPHVYQAISTVMGIMAKEGISKDRKNQQQGYAFRGIDDVYAALGKVLAENHLLILPRVTGKEREERQTQKGGLLMYTILTVEFDMVSAVDGSKHTICMIGEAMDSADKSSNKAQSAALKYACLQAFMIPTEGNNDADAETHEVAAKPQQRRTAKADSPFDEPAKEMRLTESDILMLDQIFDCKTPEELGQWRRNNEVAAAESPNMEHIQMKYRQKLESLNKPKSPARREANPLAAG